jgi:(R,R)-butanediol dehydrogenase / meso-butanediol dehydrogenase / diacetyl reductase
MTMRAAVYRGARDLRVEEIKRPDPASGELLLEIHAAGICGTDAAEFDHGPVMIPLHQRHPETGHRGPMVPGHEFAGRVVAIRDGVDGFAAGDIVASGAGIFCGRCAPCLGGRRNLCEHYATVGLQRHGALAQYCAVPARTCVSVAPYGLTEDAAALAQPMAIAAHALRRGRLEGGEQALIVGAGGIGAFLTFAAVERGAEVAVSDLDARRLEIAAALGAHHTLAAPGLQDALAERRFSPAVVYEVSGTLPGLQTALDVLPRGGRLVLVGLQKAPVELALSDLSLREVDVLGTNAHGGPATVAEALRLLAARDAGWADIAPVALPLDRLVDDGIVPLIEGRSPQIKTLVDPWAENVRPTVMASAQRGPEHNDNEEQDRR